MKGPASAPITAAATSMRRAVSHQGLRTGVLSRALRPRSSEVGGKATVSGRGGVKRRSHQMTGNAASPASIHGSAKLNDPRSPDIMTGHSLLRPGL